MHCGSGAEPAYHDHTSVLDLRIALQCNVFFSGSAARAHRRTRFEQEQKLSLIRAMGALGYAAAVFVAGKYAAARGLSEIFYIYAAAFLIAAWLIKGESEPPYYKEGSEKVGIGELFRNKSFVKLLVCVFFLMGTNVANSTYFGYLFREQGGDVAGIGLAFLLMAGSEAPFMALTPKLSAKLGTEKMILIAMILTVVRFGFYATGPDYKVLLMTFFLQGMTNGIILVEVVKCFGNIVEKRLAGMAISVYYAIGNSLSVILCSFAGGAILDIAGAKAVYLFFAIFNSVAVILYLAFGMYKGRCISEES